MINNLNKKYNTYTFSKIITHKKICKWVKGGKGRSGTQLPEMTMEDFGFIVSIKRTIVEPSVDGSERVNGKMIFFKPNCAGYTIDWRQAGLYSRETGKREENRTHGSCVYVEIPPEYREETRRQNKNGIE